MVSPGSGSWAYTKSPRASAAYLDMPTVPRNEHIYYGVFNHPSNCDSSIDLFICIPVGCHNQLFFSMCSMTNIINTANCKESICVCTVGCKP